MHYPDVLKKYGCTPERLREIFTAQGTTSEPMPPADTSIDLQKQEERPKTPADIRRRFESRIRSRILDGVANNGRSSRPFQAVDMAWDTAPIQKESMPLMLWAQGKIKIEQLCDRLNTALGTTTAQKFFKKDDKGEIKLNIPRITEIQIDLLHSYVTRRHAALNGLYSNLWPLYRYDPRGTDDVSQLRADALTQRIDIMADDYNYRHHDSQCRRDMLLYGYSTAFPRSAWDKKVGWRFKNTSTGQPGDETESYAIREGIDFVNPHPSRVFYDLSSPLANINTDTGPAWIGYWDVQRYETLKSGANPYFNLDKIVISDGWISLATQFSEFFNYYYDPTVLKWPNLTETCPTWWNTREARVGFYTSEARDMGILITEYFEKVNPKHEGIGNYDSDVWLRLSVAGDCTVINAEFMPSIPACYGAINCNDNRVENQSMAMALLGYQDQASNIVSHMIQQLRSSLMQIWMMDEDSIEPEIREQIKKNCQNQDWWVDPKLIQYSASKLRDLGIQDIRQAFAIIQNNVTNVVETGLKALGQLLNIADRLLILSPNEQGQPNPREVAAREVQEISTSVQSVYSFYSEGPREQIAAKKKLLYESLVCCGTQSFRVPIEKRYAKSVLSDAGMEIPDTVKGITADDILPVKTPVMGNLRDLVYDYYFDSREGSERVNNTQGAQVVMQLLGFLLKVPGLPQAMGVKDIYEVANLVIRMSGAPWNFQFQAPIGGPGSPLPPEGGDFSQQLQQLQQMVNQLSMRLQRTDQIVSKALGVPLQVIEGTGQPQPGAPPGASAATPHPAPQPSGAPAPARNGATPPAPNPVSNAQEALATPTQ